MITTHRHTGCGNAGKNQALLGLFNPYVAALRQLQQITLRELRAGKPLRKWRAMPGGPGFDTPLSARMLKSVQNKLAESTKAWLVLVADQVRTYITNSTLDGHQRTVLYRINANHAWWAKELVLPWRSDTDGELIVVAATTAAKADPDTIVWQPVDAADLALARVLARQAIRCAAGVPRFDRLDSIELDAVVAEEQPAATSTHFDWWVDSATLVRGHRVRIPLRNNPYFTRQYARDATVAGRLQLHRVRDQHGVPAGVDASIVVRRPDTPARAGGVEVGVDFGMRNALFATSDGQLLGARMLHTLAQWDVRLTAIAADRQRRGVSLKTDSEYTRLNRRIRDYVTNEIGRLLNQLAAREGEHRIRTLVVEKLDFRAQGMSRAMNRLITRTGRAVVKQRLAMLTPKHGITVVEVGSAWTSAQCSSCGYTHKTNRRGDTFRCRFCGRKLHADINAAKVIAQRRSLSNQGDHKLKTARNHTLQQLDTLHRQRWKMPTIGADSGVTGDQRPHTGAGLELPDCTPPAPPATPVSPAASSSPGTKHATETFVYYPEQVEAYWKAFDAAGGVLRDALDAQARTQLLLGQLSSDPGAGGQGGVGGHQCGDPRCGTGQGTPHRGGPGRGGNVPDSE